MLLSSPAFPLSINENDITTSIKKLAHSKGRAAFLLIGKKLIYSPMWFLDFATHVKKGEHVEHTKGSRAMDASKNEFDAHAAELTKNIPKETTKNPGDNY